MGIPATDIRQRLEALYAERALAGAAGLGGNALYMDDLEAEIGFTRNAYVGAAVAEIALLRARLDGPLQG
ncbi:MAG TPA: hypothetical protein VM266_01280 [Solirubrobacteraceae bacterium]|nr:hypothetical protein [Solirubrobacteraceae bacterium]